MVLLDQVEQQDKRGSLDHWVNLVHQDSLVLEVHRDSQEVQEHLETKEKLGHKVSRVHRAQQDQVDL